MARSKIITLIVLGALAVILVLQNTEVVAVRFLFWEFQASRVILLTLTLVVGFVAGLVVGRFAGKQSRRQSRP